MLSKLALIVILILGFSVQGQNTEEPPYLYYYSQMLGGLIIERADGTDSHHIAADVIRPGHYDIYGPGWSPSGRYFAGRFMLSEDHPFIINSIGESIFTWSDDFPSFGFAEWAPERDILLATNGNQFDTTNYYSSSYWLIDVATGEVLVNFSMIDAIGYERSEFIWNMSNEQLVFYIRPKFYDDNSYYRVTMQFDGTTLREPVSESIFNLNYQPFEEDPNDLFNGDKLSPSGTYQATGFNPTILTNTVTGQESVLPIHTQGMTCRDYIWHEDEDYIITLDGTQRAGGGCSSPVIGVTDSSGELWRELGACSWLSWSFSEACVGWLPDRVDVSSLPPGSDQPVQLDPVEIEYVEERLPGIVSAETLTTHLLCDDDNSAQIIDDNAPDTRYRLTDIECLYGPGDSLAGEGLPIVIAYEPSRDLLATHHDYLFDPYVTIWQRRDDGIYEQILRLNASGYELAFTEDGNFLRARNVNGWQVYAVEDILAYAERDS